MFKNWVNRIRSAFGQPKSADTIGDHCRAVDEYRADLARRGMVERPPNAERLVGGSDWIKRTGRRRREKETFEALQAGQRQPYRATW
jgi:hypothetical protein